MKTLKIASIAVGVSFVMTACMSSVSTKMVKQEGISQEEKGRNLLTAAWKAQGLDHLSEHTVYEVHATDKWKGMMGKMGKMWKDMNTDLHLKYAVGSFDGQVTFKDGKKQGLTAGLQSWNYFEAKANETAVFQKKGNKKYIFGINAYQYFFELGDRLRSAPLVTFAGEKEFKGKTYDLVFITWEKVKVHKQHDQYTVWINKETRLLEFCEFTIHDPHIAGGAMIPGSIEFGDFRDVDGVSIPFMQHIYAGSPKEKHKKFLHRLTVESFTFDSFDAAVLYPDAALVKVGDSKGK
jgi:hypothetical protein